jgi:putative ABC transport system ATP-binding protein
MQIKLENINKIYKGKNVETAALRDINLTIEEGELLAIVGTSGSGKTTLLNIIGAMDRASSGKYYFGEEEVSAYSQSKLHQFRKEKMGFVFQNFELMNRYTVFENVEMPLLARNVKKRRPLVMEQLEKMGIADLKNKYPYQLSGGQKQRCAIARALAANTEVILADEPLGRWMVQQGR